MTIEQEAYEETSLKAAMRARMCQVSEVPSAEAYADAAFDALIDWIFAEDMTFLGKATAYTSREKWLRFIGLRRRGKLT